VAKKTPSISGNEAIAGFAKFGFEEIRIRGSHHILKKPGHSYLLSVPVHGSDPVAKGTLRALLRGAGIELDDFLKAIR